jgi:hypothetical protein
MPSNLLEKTSISMLDVALLHLALKIALFSNRFSTLSNLTTVVYGISGLGKALMHCKGAANSPKIFTSHNQLRLIPVGE